MEALSGRALRLTAGATTATVAQVGASLRSLVHAGAELLDGYADDEIAAHGQGQALVPWPNRIADGRYPFGGEELQLALTEPEKRCAIHGLARWLLWEVAEADDTRALLRTPIAAQAGYPFPLRAEVEYALSPGLLDVRTTLRNEGSRAAPVGVGFHPYIRVTERIDDAVFTLPAQQRLEADDRGIPSGGLSAVAGTEYDFREGRPVRELALDTAFTGLPRDGDGRARATLAGGERAVTLSLGDGFDYIMAFTGDGLPDPARRRRAMGLEPMTCAPNAFNSGDGLVVLQQGESRSWAWGLELT